MTNPASTTPPDASHLRRTNWFLVGLLLILAVAAGTRLATLATEDLWIDEVESLINAAGRRAASLAIPYERVIPTLPDFSRPTADSTIASVWSNSAVETHPPLDFILLNLWRRVTPENEVALRTPAMIYSVLSLVPLALLLRRFAGPTPALAGTLLLAFAHAHLLVGQQVRHYALAMLLVALSWWLLVRYLDDRQPFSATARVVHLASYALLLLLAMLTHYFSALALLGQPIYAWLTNRPRRWIGPLVASGCAAAIFAIVWTPMLLRQQEMIQAQDWVRERGPDHALRTLVRLGELPIRLVIDISTTDWTPQRYAVAAAGLALTIAVGFVLWRRRPTGAACFLLWFGPTALALFLLDLLTERQLLQHLRYAALASPALIGVLTIAGAALPPRVAAAAAVLSAGTIAVTLRLPVRENPAAFAAAITLAEHTRTGDVVLIDADGWLPGFARSEYMLVRRYWPDPPVDWALVEAPPTPSLLAELARHDRIFVLSPRIDVNPNPLPQSHGTTGRSPYLRGMGWIHRFVRGAPHEADPAPLLPSDGPAIGPAVQ